MKVIFNRHIPFKGFRAISLFGVLFARQDAAITPVCINHERIHTEQMKELLYVLFYLLYLSEWLVKLFKYGKASYRNISFEREAYANQYDALYVQSRRRFAFLKYL